MAPQTVAELDGPHYGPGFPNWPVPEMEDVPVEPWAGVERSFWRDSTQGVPVDQARTAKLNEYDVAIRVGAGAPPWQGSSYGMPYQLVDAEGRTTPVYDQSRYPRESRPWWAFWAGPRFVIYPIVHLPLPERVMREGDPGGSSDMHWTGYDPDVGWLYEAITLRHPAIWDPFNNRWVPIGGTQSFGQTEWIAGYADGGVAQWDTEKPWDEAGQPVGVIASGTPKFPMIVRWDEIRRAIESGDPDRGLDHAVHGVLPNYAPEKTGPAKGTDGSLRGHPVRCGEWLRMRPEVAATYAPFTPARVIANTLRDKGWRQGDKNEATDTPARVGRGGFPLALDRRFHEGEGDIPPLGEFAARLVDFEVLLQGA